MSASYWKGRPLARTDRAFEEAVKAAYPNLLKTAKMICNRSSDAADVVQETLLRARKSWNSFRGEAAPSTWMYRILIRTAASFRENDVRGENVEDTHGRVASREPGPQTAAEMRENAARVVEAIRRLPNRQREVVTLFYLDDFSYEEVAAALDVSVGTVKSSLFAAKKTLRKVLAPNAGERAVKT